jgi:tetratricopeptide (TPR) repeat protein
LELLKGVFAKALRAETPAARAQLLDRECGSELMRRQVEQLLRAHEQARSFLDPPALRGANPGPDERERAGDVVNGRYRLIEPLGEGGMGVVWLADQLHPVRRQVAVKLIRSDWGAGGHAGRLEAEGQALALMDHPNIARVWDAGVTERRRPFIALELVRGTPLTRYCDDRGLSVPERLDLFRQICSAVQHAHLKGVVHRDLKPNNVLVTEEGGRPVPKVIDFGLAKAVGFQSLPGGPATLTGAVLGTPQYMAPEQLSGGPDVDTRIDVYALGCVLYELLTGSPPLTTEWLAAATLEQVLREVRFGDTPAPSTRLSRARPDVARNRRADARDLVNRVCGDLDWIVLKALAKERERRYETARALADDVARHLRGEPVTAAPPSAAYRVRKFVRRNRVQVLALAAVGAALTAGVIGTTVGLFRADAALAAAVASERLADQRADAERQQRLEAERQRTRADVEAETARAVQDLLLNAFGRAGSTTQARADGTAGVNPNITVREVLDRAARDLETKFRYRPLVEAAVRVTLGNAYRETGQANKGVPHLERALALRRAHLPARHPDSLAALHDLAHACLDAGAIRRCKELFQELLAAQCGLEPPNDLERIRALNGLACAYRDEGDFRRALPLLREALTAAEQRLGAKHSLTLITILNLAATYRELGDREPAGRLFQKGCAARREIYGPEHPFTLDADYGLAEFYRLTADVARALPLYERLVAVRGLKLGADHPDTLAAMSGLAHCYYQRGELDRAINQHRAVLARRRAVLGERHPDTLGTVCNLAGCLFHKGALEEAEGLFRSGLEGLTATLGADHRDTAVAAYSLGNLYRSEGRFGPAAAVYGGALAYLFGPRNADRALAREAVSRLTECFVREGREAVGRERLLELVPRAPADTELDGRDLLTLAACLNRVRAYAEAEKLISAHLAGPVPPSDDRSATWAHCQLGIALLGQKKFAEAEPHLRAGYDGLTRLERRAAPTAQAGYRGHRTEFGRHVVELYTAWGREASASEWLAKLPPEVAPPPRHVD